MSKKWKQTAESLIRTTSETLGTAAREASKRYQDSEIKTEVDKHAKSAKQWMDDKGLTETLSTIKGFTDDKLDTISGQKVLQLVQERLVIQEQYNNILATKLEEALDRIKSLEAQLKKG